MRLTKLNPETGEYEYVKKAKTFAEYIDQRKAAIQKLGFYEDIIEASFDLPDTKYSGLHHKLKVVEVAERREDIENSPVDCSTPSVTDSKGERR